MKDFDGANMLVTGGGTGLGAAIAIAAAERGARRMALVYSRSKAETEQTADRVRAAGAEPLIVQGDVSEDADCRRVAGSIAGFGHLDVLVNNAAVTKQAQNHAKLDDLDKDDFLRLYAVNVVGPYQMLRACRPLLEAAAHPAVLMISSIAGVTGIGSSVAYAASKGALNTMTLSLARALAPRIRVNAVCPGFMDTRWFSDAFSAETVQRIRDNVAAQTPLKVAAKPEDVAESALFLVSRAARHITGETLLVDAGSHLGFAPLKAR